MVTKKIISLIDQTLRTKVEERFLVENEVAVIQFSSMGLFSALVQMGCIEETTLPEGKSIPVVRCEEVEDSNQSESLLEGTEVDSVVEDGCGEEQIDTTDETSIHAIDPEKFFASR